MTKHDSIGDYYRKKDEDARRLEAELVQARERGADSATIKRIEYELEMARFVGD